jgi:hypothetical protein
MKSIDAIRKKNCENLYSFYLNLADKSGFITGAVSSVQYISNNTLSWPSYILGGGKMAKSSLTDIFGRMKDGTLPFFWIRPVEDDPEFDEFAGVHGIRKVNFWRGMYLKKTTPFKLLPEIHGLVFEEVKTQKDLRDWLQVVNMEIMSHRELGISSFLNVLHDPDFRFFRVTRAKKTVSTILMHKGKSETGIYLVSTVLSDRGKGIGRWITASAIDLYITEGFKEFVLHATPLGYPVYRKLGFEECGEYGIYWLMGKKS